MELGRRKRRLKRGGEFVSSTTDEEDATAEMEEEEEDVSRRKRSKRRRAEEVSKTPPPPSSCLRPPPSLPLPSSSQEEDSSSFLPHREVFAVNWYQEFNRRIFRGHLPSSLCLAWPISMTSTAGKCVVFKLACKCERGPCKQSVQHYLDGQKKRRITSVSKLSQNNNLEKQDQTASPRPSSSPSTIQQEEEDVSITSDVTTQEDNSSAASSCSGLWALPVNLRSSILRFPDGHWGSVRVQLSPKLLTNSYRLCQTLLHELCHAAQFFFEPSTMATPSSLRVCETCQQEDKQTDKQKTFVDRRPHGPAFWKYAKIASLLYPSLEVSRCHCYELNKS
eukprot:GHVS01053748.1.p1 GENE.GHVS01053748.1~~GHVS01053748.1.p1  ORF type:complete len:335 (+),score=83.14 GHVS01053748.1:163-1167(+)